MTDLHATVKAVGTFNHHLDVFNYIAFDNHLSFRNVNTGIEGMVKPDIFRFVRTTKDYVLTCYHNQEYTYGLYVGERELFADIFNH